MSLYGSLAFTGLGHATDRAVVLGLAGMVPEQYNVSQAEGILLAAGFAHNAGRVAAGKVAAAAQGLAAARAATGVGCGGGWRQGLLSALCFLDYAAGRAALVAKRG